MPGSLIFTTCSKNSDLFESVIHHFTALIQYSSTTVMHYYTNTVMHYYINVKVSKSVKKRVAFFQNRHYNIDKEREIKKKKAVKVSGSQPAQRAP